MPSPSTGYGAVPSPSRNGGGHFQALIYIVVGSAYSTSSIGCVLYLTVEQYTWWCAVPIPSSGCVVQCLALVQLAVYLPSTSTVLVHALSCSA